jgi:hypothetical protein
MAGHWLFEHDTMLDPYWKPAPGQTYKADCPKALCEVTLIRQGRAYWRYLGMEGPARWHMAVERWRTMGPAERQCPDCEDWDVLVATDCCDGPKFECRTRVLLDGAGDPDVTVCLPHHGCNRGAYAT